MAHKDIEFWQMTAAICDTQAYIDYLNEQPLSKNKKRNHLIAWAKAHNESPQQENFDALTKPVII